MLKDRTQLRETSRKRGGQEGSKPPEGLNLPGQPDHDLFEDVGVYR